MIHGAPVNPRLLEIVDGVLIPMLSITVFFTVWHVARLWNDCRIQFPGKGGFWKCIRGIYYERKPSIAFLVFVSALLARFGNFWYHRHVTNHGGPPDWLVSHSTLVFLVATTVLIIGVICWNRNIAPIPIPNWLWVLIIGGAVLWAYWMAGFPSWDELISSVLTTPPIPL